MCLRKLDVPQKACVSLQAVTISIIFKNPVMFEFKLFGLDVLGHLGPFQVINSDLRHFLPLPCLKVKISSIRRQFSGKIKSPMARAAQLQKFTCPCCEPSRPTTATMSPSTYQPKRRTAILHLHAQGHELKSKKNSISHHLCFSTTICSSTHFLYMVSRFPTSAK